MSMHEYSAEKALDLLMAKLRKKDAPLADHVQSVIDAGMDQSVTEPPSDRRKKPRVYRTTRPFTHQEALNAAVDALQAYFVEQPLFENSLLENVADAAIGVPSDVVFAWEDNKAMRDALTLMEERQPKKVEIELQTETQLSSENRETMIVMPVSTEQIAVQRKNIAVIRKLFDFGD